MKKKLPIVYGLFWTLLAGLLFLSNNSNPPNGYTGAPPSGQTCASCHSGGGASGNVTITGLPATINPGQQYPIVVSVTRTNSTPQKAGFQMTVLGSGNTFAGAFSGAGGGATIQTTGGISYLEQSTGQNFGANNTINFTVTWTAPATGSGNVTFYAAANLANGNGSTSGDYITTTTATGNLDNGGGSEITVDVNGTNLSCFGSNDGQATANVTQGGGGPYFYSWSNGQTTQTISNLAPGTYSVTVTDGSGGLGTGSVIITQPTAINVSISNVTQITCANPIASATAQASGGTPGYTYNWSNGDTGPTGTFDAPGNYGLTVTDSQGCDKTASVNITANTPLPTANAGPDRQLTCAAPTITLSGAGSSTGTGITYSWSGPGIVSGANTLTPTVNAAGLYTLTVTNQNNGCSQIDDMVVDNALSPPTAQAGPDQQLTCTSPTVTLNGTGSSAGAGITYSWSGPGIVSGANTLTPVVNAAGTYTLTVTNQSQICVATDAVVVANNAVLPTAQAGPDQQLTCASLTVTLNGMGSSAGAGITYTWTGPGIVSGINTLAPVVNAAGTYTLTVNNTNNGCSKTDEVVVTANFLAPVANAGPDRSLTCVLNSLVLDGSASSAGTAFSYTWTGPGITAGANTPTPTVNAAGTYILSVSNMTNGCVSTDTTLVTTNTSIPTANAGPDGHLSCAMPLDTLNAGGSSTGTDVTYSWSGPGILSGGTTLMPVVNATGTYVLSVSNTASGCTTTDTLVVTQNAPLSLSVQAFDATCFGSATGVAIASASGGNGIYTYLWSNGDTSAQPDSLLAGSYTLTLSDGEGCTTTATLSIGQSTPLIVNIAATPESTPGAADGTALATPSGGVPPYAFAWSTTATTAGVAGLAPGTYTLVVTDSLGCTATANAIINNAICTGFALQLNATNLNCHSDSSGSISATLSGGAPGFSYLWSTGSTNSSVSALAAGAYSVTVSDSNNCMLSASVSLSQPEPLMLGTVAVLSPTCPGVANGSIEVQALGGTAPFDYLWAMGDTTPVVGQLLPGTYSLTLTDSRNCQTSSLISLSLAADTIAPSALVRNLTLTLDTNGQATLTVDQVDNGSTDNCGITDRQLSQTSFDCSHLGTQQVALLVRDAAGNLAIDSAFVTIIDTLAPVVICPANITTMVCGGSIEYDLPTVSDNCANPLLSLSAGLPSGSVFPLGETTVSYTLTDAAANSSQCSFVVRVINSLQLSGVEAVAPACFGTQDGQLSLFVSGGTAPYTYSWNDPANQTTATATGLGAGMYTVVVTDAGACSQSLSFELQQPTAVAITLDASTPETGANADGAIAVSVSGGQGSPYTYQWLLNSQVLATTEDLSALVAGTYTLIATDANGCSDSLSVVVDRLTGTQQTPWTHQIRVFPNPTPNYVSVVVESDEAINWQLNLLDLSGRSMLSPMRADTRQHTFVLDLSQQPAGVYLLQLIANDQVQWHKLRVQR